METDALPPQAAGLSKWDGVDSVSPVACDRKPSLTKHQRYSRSNASLSISRSSSIS